jgi:Ser/Thr protein kinase RdoA (MazF antagonist)
MKPYHTLTHRGQIQRLKALASAALTAYPLTPTHITPMTHLFNTTFRVETPTGRYVLRIGRPDFRTIAELQSEIAWLAAIRHDTNLAVPNPIANRQGDLVTIAEAPGVPEARACVLFRWMDGRFHRQSLRPADLALVGRFMAHLHHYVQNSFSPPANFTRPHLGMEGEMGHIVEQGLADGIEIITPAGRDLLLQTVEHAQSLIATLDRRDPAVYNLIHADLHQANYLFHNGRVHAIDFDDCGFGHFLYDIAVTFWYIRKHPDFPAMRAAFLAAYQAERPLPDHYERYLDTFMALRSVLLATYAASETNPRIRAIAPRFVGGIIEELKTFNQTLTISD